MQHSTERLSQVRALSDHFGLASSYVDGVGVKRTLSSESLVSILTAMGVTTDAREHGLESCHERSWGQLVQDGVVITEGTRRPSLLISIPLGPHQLEDVRISWTLTDETHKKLPFFYFGKDCQVIEQKVFDHVTYVRILLPLHVSLVLGYYDLSLSVEIDQEILAGSTFLIVAPRQCYMPRRPSQSFGVSVQLYNLHSTQNWGIGDFRDLRGLLRWARKDLRAATIGVSPLHDTTAGVHSPYSPSSRLFFNPLYLDLEAIPEFRSTPVIQRQFRSKRFQKKLQGLRLSRLVQYKQVRSLKMDMLERLFCAFQRQHVRPQTARFRTFRRYCVTQHEYLEPYCLFQVLSEQFGTSAWRQWPMAYHHPHTDDVQSCLQTSQDRIRFFQYVQWQCEQQLSGLDRMAKRLNLPYKLYHDLPVGVHPDGVDAWIFQDELATGITLGAPPDNINLQGQNWGLMAPVPWRMRSAGYRFFIETIRRNMQYAGMIRIDHALGLFRLFIIPEGQTGEAGTYVKTQVDELLAIVALESVRHQVMVIGEDLGAVTPEIRARLAKAGILSYRLMPFEKTPTGKFRTPKQYPKQAMVSFDTHDLPTLKGYWAGRDIEIKTQANLYQTEQQIEQEWKIRMQDRLAFLKALVNERLLPKQALSQIPSQAPDSFIYGAYAYLARTPCRMLMITLEDLLGELEAPNLPGASEDAYPSWQLRLGQSFQSFRRDPRILLMVESIPVIRKLAKP